MWKWILQAIQIASAINLRRSTILFVLELLKQFERSLVKSDGQPKGKVSGKSGFVYIIRDRANGERFKVGCRAKRPWRDGQLRSDLGESGDFILIIPAKNASALEKRLRRAYAMHSKRGEWFSLNDRERREILIIAALLMVVAGDTLGMAPVDAEIRDLGKRLFSHAKALAGAMWNDMQSSRTRSPKEDGTSVNELDPDSFSAIPNIDWEWESMLNKDCRSLKHKGLRSTSKPLRVVWSPAQSGIK